MKVRKLIIGLIGFILSIGSVAFTNVTTKTVTERVSAATANAVFDKNPSVSTRYKRSDTNPSSFTSKSDSTDYNGLFNFSEMSTVATQYSCDLGTNVRLYETAATNLFSSCYFPLRLFVPNQDAYSKATVSVSFSLSLEGGKSNNYANMRLYYFGTGSNSSNSSKVPTTVAVCKNVTFLGSVNSPEEVKCIGNNTDSTATTDSYVLSNQSASNNTKNANNILCCYLGLFVGARKDSSSQHQITARLSAVLTISYQYYVAKDSVNTVYLSFEDAINNTTTRYVYLLASTTLSNDFTINKEMTIYMGSYTLDCGTHSLAIGTSGCVVFEDTGLITGSITNGSVIVNNGELTLYKTPVTNTSTNYSTAKGITNFNTLYVGSSVSAGGYAVYNKGTGQTRIAGSCKLTSYNNYPLMIESGVVYISNTGGYESKNSIYENIYFDQAAATLYGKDVLNSVFFGPKVSVKLNTLGDFEDGDIVIRNASDIAYYDIVYPLINNQAFAFDHPNKNIVFVNNKYKNITYNLTHCSLETNVTRFSVTQRYTDITIVPDENYSLPNSIDFYVNGVLDTEGEYYMYWESDGQVTINGTKIANDITISCTCVVVDADLEAAENFVNTYMHMSSNVEGQCNSYYTAAKAAFNALAYDVRYMILNDTKYEDAANRLRAWANHFGETIDNCVIQANTSINNISSSNNYLIITIISIAALLSFTAVIILRKKKHEN